MAFPSLQSTYHQLNPFDAGRTYSTDQANTNPTGWSSGQGETLGSFWRGADNNVYVYGDQGANAAGAWDNNSSDYWNKQGYTQISDPYAGQVLGAGTTEGSPNPNSASWYGSGSGGSGGSGGAPAAPAYDPLDMLFLDEQIEAANRQLGRIGGQRTTGLGNIASSLADARGKLGTQRESARGAYETRQGRDLEDYSNVRSGVRRDAGQQYSALQRLLGSAGAGRSSAAQILTPFAVGREAAQRFGQTQNQFERNQSDLDTSYATTTQGFTDAEKDLKRQEQEQKAKLQTGLASSEADLQDQLSGLALRRQSLLGGGLEGARAAINPYKSRIQELLKEIDSYGDLAITPTERVDFTAPDLEQYNYSRFANPTLGATGGSSDYANPFIVQQPQEEEERLRVR